MTTTTAPVESPEVLLKGLNRSMIEALARMEPRFKQAEDKELLHRWKSVLRRTFTIELLSGLDFIAVAGAQGAGKTTLLCQMYELEHDLLSPNSGLGESLPVLVIEDPNVSDPQRWLYTVPQDSGAELLSRGRADQQEWEQALTGSNPQVLVAELRVPQRFFHGAQRGFVLLPGYETPTRSNRVAQTLMRESLITAQGAVIVTDRTRLADDKHSEMARDIAGHVSDPVVIVTKRDSLTEQHRAEIIGTIQRVFGVRSDRVAFSDITDRDLWLPEVLQRLSFLSLRDSTRTRQLEVLKEAMDDLGNLETELMELLVAKGIDDSLAARPWEKLVGEYDRATTRALGDLDRDLAKALRHYRGAATDRAKRTYEAQEGGPKNKLTNHFINETEKDFRRRAALEGAWITEELGDTIADVLRGVAVKRSQPPIGHRNVSAIAGRAGAGTTADAESSAQLVIPDSIADQLSLLLGGKGDPNADLLEAVRLLPSIGLYVASLAVRDPSVRAASAKEGVDGAKLSEQLMDLASENRGVLLGLFSLFGLDVALDGTLDGPAQTASAIHSGLMALGLSSTAASVALALGAAAAGVLVAVHVMNSADRKRLEAIEVATSGISDATFAEIRESVARVLSLGREALVEKGSKLLQLDAPAIDRIWASKTVADVREQRVLIEKSIAGNPLALMS